MGSNLIRNSVKTSNYMPIKLLSNCDSVFMLPMKVQLYNTLHDLGMAGVILLSTLSRVYIISPLILCKCQVPMNDCK